MVKHKSTEQKIVLTGLFVNTHSEANMQFALSAPTALTHTSVAHSLTHHVNHEKWGDEIYAERLSFTRPHYSYIHNWFQCNEIQFDLIYFENSISNPLILICYFLASISRLSIVDDGNAE